jgi:hypothetical protein
MREKLKLKKDKDFFKALKINKKRVQEIQVDIKTLEGPPMTEVIKKLWENKNYSDNEIIYSIFILGMANARRELFNQGKSILGGLTEILGGILNEEEN